jgi:hypothetical protein
MSKKTLNLQKISVKEYAELSDTTSYDVILRHCKPEKNFLDKDGDILQMSYTNVKYCLSILTNDVTWKDIAEVFYYVFGVSESEFFNADIVSYFKAKNYIDNTFKTILDNEIALSKGGNVNVSKWQSAGGDRLTPYEKVLSLDQLGERYGIYPFDLGRKPYSEIFYLIAMVKTVNEVNYNYSKEN